MQFLKSDAGKIGLVVVLFLVAIAILFFRGGGEPSREAKIRFVCVATGETLWIERGKSKILPLTNPDTGEKTLLPCHQNEDGNLYVSSRCRSLVEQLEENGVNQYIDPQTLLVRARP